jgi:hypothetical protein
MEKPIFAGIKDGKVITGGTREEVQALAEEGIPVMPFRNANEANERMPVFAKQHQKWRVLSKLNAIDRMYGSRQLREIAIEVAKKSGVSDSKALERLVQAEKEAEVFRGKLSAFLPVIKG